MIDLRKIYTLLLLLCLIGCGEDDNKATVSAQQFPKFDTLQSPSEIQQLETSLVSNPNDFNALSALADRYFEASRYVEAIQTYDKALVLNPMSADCLNDKGLAFFYMGNTESALESFDQAVAAEPGFANAWLSKGYVLIAMGKYQEAIAPLNKVKEFDSNGGLAAEAEKFLALAAEKL